MEQKPSLLGGRSNMERKNDAAKRKAFFLATYEEWGTIKKACEVAGIARKTYKNWLFRDHGFSGEMAEAKRAFGEMLEGIALERVMNPDKGKGSDLLLLGMLNANMSEKYRPTMALNEDSAREVISELRKISREKRTDGPVTDGPVKEDRGELSDPYKKQLVELLEKKGNATEKREEPEDGQQEHSDA